MDSSAPTPGSPVVPPADAASVPGGNTLVTPEQLAEALSGEAPPALLDIRWSLGGPPGADEYAAGHLPGACFVSLDDELAAPPGPAGRHPLPTREVLAAALRRAGVRADRPVVVYDAGPATSAARAWWLLRWAGHPDVRVLDGGLRAWQEAGLPLTTEVPPPGDGDFEPAPGALPVLDADAAALLPSEGLLFDARAGERYRGETEPVDPRAGHIPGAVSAPTTENLDEHGRFLPAPQLAARFAGLAGQVGIAADQLPRTRIGVYCGSGVTASHELLALHLAGLAGTLYPGSWSEWSADPSRPAATGPRP